MSKSNQKINLLSILAVVILSFLPFVFLHGAKFEGADDRSTAGIKEVQPNYQPWFKSVFEPQSSEIENFLFATQAAIGSGITCYILGLYKGRSEQRRAQEESRRDAHSPDKLD